jgi:hypothetical protein
MNAENLEHRDPYNALSEIKDKAVMLSMAGEYLCEDPFLKKIGFSIRRNMEDLKADIEALKRQFVGKPVEEVNFDKHLQGIEHIAKLLQEGAEDVEHRCIRGELGKELGERVISLAGEIKGFKDRVEGRTISYTRADSVLGVLGRLKFLINTLVATYSLASKIIGLFLMVGLMTLSFLFITMESEKGLINKIEEIRTLIQSSEAALSNINDEVKQIQKLIDNIREGELNRQDGIELMDLNLEAYKLAEEQQQALIKVMIQKKTLEERLKRLDEMNRKSFFERLVRL